MRTLLLIGLLGFMWPACSAASELDRSPAAGVGAELEISTKNPYPDLLIDSTDANIKGPDLLGDDPFVMDPVEHFNDPIFEDDFTLNPSPPSISDPFEPMNRAIFVFNDKLYFWVLKPTKNVYGSVLPEDIRRCLGNAFANIAAPIRFINNLLQGEFEDAGVVLGRFVINSTLGIFGLGDAAYRDFNIEPRKADFGQTLGKWGLGEGPYIILPGLGPSNARDTVGFIGDIYMHPVPYISENYKVDLGYLVLNQVNLLSISPDVYEELKRMSLDPYVAARQAYIDYRRSVIDNQ
jgi:phospholipid-binding lipoprotein MlaA